jgi:hypothetical protein
VTFVPGGPEQPQRRQDPLQSAVELRTGASPVDPGISEAQLHPSPSHRLGDPLQKPIWLWCSCNLQVTVRTKPESEAARRCFCSCCCALTC